MSSAGYVQEYSPNVKGKFSPKKVNKKGGVHLVYREINVDFKTRVLID